MKKIIFILLLCSFTIHAQVVCNSITKKPIIAVSIVSNKDKGTITNQQGRFTVQFFEDFKTLTFSHLAYQTKTISRKELTKVDTLFLKPVVINLTEVVLKTFNAKDTLQKAIRRIPINYNFKPYNTQGFYRESMLEDSIGVEMTEVSFKTYSKTRKDRPIYNAKIIKGRRTNNYTAFHLVFYGGIQQFLLVGDKVRQKIAPFNIKNLSDYKFSYKGSISNAKGKIYLINFRPLKDTIYRYNIGKIYMDASTLAILQISIKKEKDKKEIKRLTKKIYTRSNKQKKPMYAVIAAEGTVQYKKYRGEYYLSFMNIKNTFKGAFKKESHTYKINAKLIVTQINTVNPKKIKTNYKLKKDFNKQVKEIPQLENWAENNTLLFSKQDKKVLKDIKNRHEK